MKKSKINIGDLLFDGHYYGIVTGVYAKDSYSTSWYLTRKGAWNSDVLYGKGSIRTFKGKFDKIVNAEGDLE